MTSVVSEVHIGPVLVNEDWKRCAENVDASLLFDGEEAVNKDLVQPTIVHTYVCKRHSGAVKRFVRIRKERTCIARLLFRVWMCAGLPLSVVTAKRTERSQCQSLHGKTSAQTPVTGCHSFFFWSARQDWPLHLSWVSVFDILSRRALSLFLFLSCRVCDRSGYVCAISNDPSAAQTLEKWWTSAEKSLFKIVWHCFR